jgi:hypothetical protein
VPENPVVGGKGIVIVFFAVDAAGVTTLVCVKAAKTGRMGDELGNGTLGPGALVDVPQATVSATPASALKSAQV